jgi:hypothetical protein
MEILNSFLGQGMIAQIGEIVLFANTVTMAMPTRWRGNIAMDYISKILNGFNQIYEPHRRSRKEKKRREKLQKVLHLDPAEFLIEMHCLSDECVKDLCKEKYFDIEREVVTNSVEEGYRGEIEFYDPRKKIPLLRRGRVRKFLSQMYFVRKVSAH